MFIELQVQYMKIPSSNLGRTCCAQTLFLTFRTIFVHNMYSPMFYRKESFWQRFTFTTKLNAWMSITIQKIKFLLNVNFWWCFSVQQSEISLLTLYIILYTKPLPKLQSNTVCLLLPLLWHDLSQFWSLMCHICWSWLAINKVNENQVVT